MLLMGLVHDLIILAGILSVDFFEFVCLFVCLVLNDASTLVGH